ncbi:MAG TPA: right-handed parallel beta-helix repeat-containing protein, partial [Chthoniobacteraceae bacterium]|nr:right-handed parallel beta-helix repeat-containing protein [Chthoniobacteraceae bacterium]
VAEQSAPPAPTNEMTVPDQFPTIQAAIDNTPAGQTITVRPGVYSEAVSLKDGIRLEGGDGGECRLTSTAGVPAIIFLGGVRGCSLENLVLDGSEAPANSVRTDGIAISDAEVKVTRCTVRGMSGSGIVVHGTDTAADIQENHLENNAAHGALILRTGGPVVLRKNEFRKNKGSGLQFDEGANGIADDNLSEENGESGIGATGVSTSPKLQNNRCNANIRNGITFAGAARGSALGNTCEKNGESGLAAIGEGTAPDFLKNTARGNTKFGIYFAGGADGEARENLCEENRMSGIGAANTSTRPELSGNQLARNQEFGIDLSNGASPRIAQDNIFTSNAAGEISR